MLQSDKVDKMNFEKYSQLKGKGIKIVVIDSGINLKHPLFRDKKINGYSINNEHDVIADHFCDKFGHGTAVYSLIKNIVPESEIIVFKIFEHDLTCTQEAILNALQYIYNNIECDLINISAGTCTVEDDSLYNLCKKLYNRGSIITAAFDNSGAVSYPAMYDCVIGVDNTASCKTINEFEYIYGSEINIRAKGGMNRVAWVKPEYAFVEGTSFSIAYVTSMIAKIMQSGVRSLPDLLSVFKKNAKLIYHCSEDREDGENNPFKIHKAVIFPYSKETDSFINFPDLIQFDILHVCEYKLSGKIGLRLPREYHGNSLAEKRYEVEDIDKLDWEEDFDALILGHVDDISFNSNKDYKEILLNKCIDYNKNIYMFDYNDKYSDKIKQLRQKGMSVYYPRITNCMLPKNRFGKMFRINTPVLGIFGTSSRQGKFTLQLRLLQYFHDRDYEVASIGTEPTALLFGMDLCYPMGYHCAVYTKSYDSVYLLNSFMSNLEKKHPDIIMVGSQYCTIPIDTANIAMFTNVQYDFIMGTQPEAVLLTINPFDEPDYIKRTIGFIESSCAAKVLALVVFPIDIPEDWSGFYGKKEPLKEEKFIELKNKYEKYFHMPVISLNSNIASIAELVTDYFT